MKQTFLAFFLFLSLLLGFGTSSFACDTDKVRDYKPILPRLKKGLLFMVDNCKSPTSYIYGTIHMDDKDIHTASQPAFEVMVRQKRAIFEMKSSQQTQQSTIAMMILPPTEKRTLSDIIGLHAFEQLTHEMQKNQPGFPLAVLERYRPWAAGLMVQLPPPSNDNISLDDRLQIEAQKHSIPVIGLENPMTQMAVFEHMTESEQKTFLLDTLASIDTLRDQNKQLKRLYLRKDIQDIYRLGLKAFREIRDSKMRGYIRYSLLTQRNAAMAKELLPHLQNGASFIAVGTLHLPGQDGLLTALEKAGYFIWPVTTIPSP